MHRNNIVKKHRVLADHPFSTEAEAVSEAAEVALKLVERRQRRYVFHP
ncbi:hypothetical protein [Janthinobacterium lividum]|nr:hypothetical protein [Janthinobacterium lividum]